MGIGYLTFIYQVILWCYYKNLEYKDGQGKTRHGRAVLAFGINNYREI
jgi:hypothetical protein